MSYPLLFKPMEIRALKLENRIVMPAMGNNLSDDQGHLTPRALAYYLARARGGTGLIVTEAIPVNLTGKHRAGCLCFFDASHQADLERLTSAVHKAGSKIAIQLHHAGRLVNPQVSGRQVVSASAVPVRDDAPVPKPMGTDEIEATISDFASAAKRAVQVGFDAIEIHGAHGYLIHQFFSPRSNQRRDDYGGSLENRMRFPLDVTRAVREAVGKDFPLIYRVSAREYEEGSYPLEEALVLGKGVREAGVDILHVSAGTTESPRSALYAIQPQALPEACLAPFAEAFKQEIGLPVIGVGRISGPETAEEVLGKGMVDLVAMGRALLADPQWPIKAREGRSAAIRRCIACNRCLDAVVHQEPIVCSVNPLTGREDRLAPQKGEGKKTVVVAGAGPSGLEAACTAASLGHRVVLYDREERIGGQLWAASVPPHKGLIKTIIDYYDTQLPLLGVEVRLGEEVTEATVEARDPDLLILATGCRPSLPALPGIDEPNVVTAWDALLGKGSVGDTVLVVGGGLVGSETAEFLAARGSQVLLIEELEDVALDVEARSRLLLLERLERLGVETWTGCRLLSIGDGEALVDHHGRRRTIRADFVVLAVGSEPNNRLELSLPTGRWKLKAIGDCRAPGNIKEAIHQGFWDTCEALG